MAGVSIGSLYQYFPNKDALVTAVIERTQAQLLADLQAAVSAVADAPLEQALRALVGLAISQQYGNPLLAAALDHEEKRLPLGKTLRRVQEAMADAVSSILRRHHERISRDIQATAAKDCLTIAKALVEADAQSASAPPPDLAPRVTQALLGYLCYATPRVVSKTRTRKVDR